MTFTWYNQGIISLPIFKTFISARLVQVTAERERILKGEEAEEKERRRLEAFHRMVFCNEKKNAGWLEGIEQRDKQAAQALEVKNALVLLL